MARYARLKSDEIGSHHLANRLQALLLFCAMLAFLGLLGYSLAGFAGVTWASALGLLTFLISQRIGPLMVLRLYQARLLTPEMAPELYAMTAQLAERAQLPQVPALYYVPSGVLNAFTVKFQGLPVIGVTDGLLRSLSSRELATVLAHEIGHIRHQDLTVMGLADVISRLTYTMSVAGQLTLLFSLPFLWMKDVTLPWASILLMLIAPTLNSLLQLALSRTREFDADLEAVRLTGDPVAAIAALEKIEGQGTGLFERIFFPGRRVPAPSLLRTHPETAERIERIRSMAEVYTVPTSLWELMEWLPRGAWRVERPPRWHWGGLWH